MFVLSLRCLRTFWNCFGLPILSAPEDAPAITTQRNFHFHETSTQSSIKVLFLGKVGIILIGFNSLVENGRFLVTIAKNSFSPHRGRNEKNKI